jgi:hypothetical protein
LRCSSAYSKSAATGLAPTGIAASATTLYLGDDPNESIDQIDIGSARDQIGGFAISDATPTQLALERQRSVCERLSLARVGIAP